MLLSVVEMLSSLVSIRVLYIVYKLTRRATRGNFKGKCCMVEVGHRDTGFPIETLGLSHDT